MPSTYNHFAGRSVERLAALSDGIFGVGMTLLVLDLRAPLSEVIHSEHDLGVALVGILPQLIMYMMSFLTLGIFWVGQQTQLSHLERSDRHLTWITLAFLFAVTLLPFSTKLLAEHYAYRTALIEYWFNILLLGALLYGAWGYGVRHRMLKPETPAQVAAVVCHRILWAQGLYLVAALFCVIDTRLSIALIVLLQLYYAVAPGFRSAS
ncbi:MAG TPA: TMEM175 family protein [Opitutaceae bacterium]